MRDTIYRDEAVEVIKAWFKVIKLNPDILIDGIISLPSAEKIQGEWTQNVFRSDIYRYECSNCKAHHRARYDYCPSCGARMQKGIDNER